MTSPRNVSVEALALRAQQQLKTALNDALILQDDLLIAYQQIRDLQTELETLKAKPDGNAA